MTTVPRLGALAALTLLATTLIVPQAARADELGTSARPAGFVVHSAEETLRDFCSTVDGRLVFTVPGGASWELVTSTADPSVSNPGDGGFHPFDVAEVEAALGGVHYPLQRIAAEVFLLPFPRRDGLDSAAGPGLILLSPGVRPISSGQQQAEFVHELGHVVQYALMPDADTQGWSRYRQLRGITDVTTYSAGSIHADRPHEIFAEDFRALFGPQAANAAGTIENAALTYPTSVAGLPEFVWSLSDAPIAPGALTVLGSLSRGDVSLERLGAASCALDLFDLSGRRIASLPPRAGGPGVRWTWDGRDDGGRLVRGAVIFARTRDGRGGVARIVRLP